MKNFFKKLITCSIAVCLIAVTLLAGACDTGNNGTTGGGETHSDPTKNGYTISVLYPDGTPVKGSDGPSVLKKVGVQLMDASGNGVSDPVNISEYGTALINYKVSGEFMIDVYNVPNGFDYTDKVQTVKGRGDYTVTLTAGTLDYSVTLKLPDGTPANGVKANLKKGGTVVKSATSDSNGKAVWAGLPADNYDLELLELPENVSLLPVQITAKKPNLTVELITLIKLEFDEVMSAEQLEYWDKLANSYGTSDGMEEVTRFSKSADCYDFKTPVIPEGKKVYFCFTADKEGEYRFITDGKYYNVDFYGNYLGEVQDTVSSTHESLNKCEMFPLPLKEGESCYFSFSIPARSTSDPDDTHELTGTRHFMIAKPVAGVKRNNVDAPTASSPTVNYNVSFELDTALLVVITADPAIPGKPTATDGGKFEIYSTTDEYDVEIIHYARLAGNSEIVGSDDDSGEGKNFKYAFEVPPSYSGGEYFFRIKIKSKLTGGEVDYPTEVPITIVRTGNAEENMSPVEDQHATATEKYAEQSGTFHFLLGDDHAINENSFTIVAKNGGYYVNIDGTERELVIAISKNICSLNYSYATIEYMGGGDRGGSGSDELPGEPFETKQNNYLTLYSDPSKGEDKNNPKLNFAPFIDEYTQICNSDGVYKLNDELKRFAQMYYDQHSNDLIYGLALSECCWLISCGYYA